MSEKQNEAETVAQLAREAANGNLIGDGDGRKFLVVSKDSRAVEVTDPHGLMPAKPAYISQAVTLETRESLIDYVNRFKTAETMLFANMNGSAIAAVLDYHGESGAGEARNAGAGVEDRPGAAEHAAHRATMDLPFSEEWKIWTGVNGTLMKQLDFARFIEENRFDILAPPSGALIDCVRDLQSVRNANFQAAVNTASDNVDFEYTVETATTTKQGDLTLPKEFVLRIPVYFGEEPTELHAFLRYRSDDAQLSLGIKLDRPEYVRQACFKLIATEVREATGAPLVYGRVEKGPQPPRIPWGDDEV